MKKERAPRTVLVAGIAAVLAGTVLLFVLPVGPGGDGPPPAPGPVARAVSAVEAGAQASLPELAALIGDREKWLRRHPGDDESWAALGAAYVERGTREGDSAAFPRAERALKRSLAVFPGAKGNAGALAGMGALANARGDFVAAKQWGEAARRAKPRRWQTYPVLVDAYTGLGDYTSAGRALEQLRALRQDGPTLSRATLVFGDRGWREDASAVAQDAVALAATKAEKASCLQRLGDLAWERGEPAEALGAYDAALRLVRGHAPSLAGRARALASLGRTDEALREYGAALSAAPLPEYTLASAELHESVGLDGDARTQYEMLRVRSAEGLTHGVNRSLALARYETDHGDPDAAVTWLGAEWARHHRSVHVADALGWALYRAGRPQEALPYAVRATGTGLRSALFMYHRGQIERALEKYGAARRHIEEALRINPAFSPLLAPRARRALEVLGEPPAGGPAQVYGARPRPQRKSGAAASAGSGSRSSGSGSRKAWSGAGSGSRKAGSGSPSRTPSWRQPARPAGPAARVPDGGSGNSARTGPAPAGRGTPGATGR
ncbi:tetratricopeptide repeat protein [Streptomyces sp. SP18CS02]|uniref:tetratricopeptide repeat protein n=1 Tax=Streptomyces sp. SP18CS02 TaxID=3002531 RepID=UPI002E79F28A|nr:tetratricopeptide repeat protein [Streptomyces sp. SP18CS02]MEE1752282.1 tetratricopeptide repeat protein [Streptomyces sp. SP18CS02]